MNYQVTWLFVINADMPIDCCLMVAVKCRMVHRHAYTSFSSSYTCRYISDVIVLLYIEQCGRGEVWNCVHHGQ